MKLHGFINVITTRNQSAIININQVSSVISQHSTGNAVVTLNNGESYELDHCVSEVISLIKEEQNQ